MPVTARMPTSQCFLLHGVDWDFYEELLRRLDDRHVFVTYDRGDLELMSPSQDHEVYKSLIRRFIEQLTLELNIPIMSLGSMTFRRKKLKRGLEPDECYYIQNEARVRMIEIDLKRDPPPDLALEVEISRRLLDRVSIYAKLGVPEIWRFDGKSLRILLRGPDGDYHPSDRSASLPMLPPADLVRFIRLRATLDETTLVRQFRAWVREKLAGQPRSST